MSRSKTGAGASKSHFDLIIKHTKPINTKPINSHRIRTRHFKYFQFLIPKKSSTVSKYFNRTDLDIIMKKAFLIIISAISIINVSYAKDSNETSNPNDKAVKCTSQCKDGAQKLPLDHGPHATVTPWVNAQRKQTESK